MTINLTELRDEPLGKHPIQAHSLPPVSAYRSGPANEQDVVAADDESSFTFDVEGLGDEPLDAHPVLRSFAQCHFVRAWARAAW